MNKQPTKNGQPAGIEWTFRRLPDGTVLPGYTWNPLGGCKHGCRWEMPNGDTAECYAKTVAERVAQAAYPQGFEHHYSHPERLDEPFCLQKPAGIFLDSMSDLMGSWVTDDEIESVLAACRRAHWHTFFALTKNAPRLSRFEFPPNVWVGASSPPDWMYGKRLTPLQQERMMHKTMETLSGVNALVRWLSGEPWSRNYAPIIAQYPGALNWMVVGAASNGRTLYDVNTDDLRELLAVLDAQRVPVFFKGNMRINSEAAANWRQEFPNVVSGKVSEGAG